MRKLSLLLLVVFAGASAALAQGADDFNKWDVYAGYSLGRFKTNVNSASFTSSSGTESFSNLCSSATGDMIGPNFQKFFCPAGLIPANVANSRGDKDIGIVSLLI